uniref:Uncharacterized protein n=1 Tax=Glossina austeni TaxID=7395 RepID=A0A1A9UNC8_GLOAU
MQRFAKTLIASANSLELTDGVETFKGKIYGMTSSRSAAAELCKRIILQVKLLDTVKKIEIKKRFHRVSLHRNELCANKIPLPKELKYGIHKDEYIGQVCLIMQYHRPQLVQERAVLLRKKCLRVQSTRYVAVLQSTRYVATVTSDEAEFDQLYYECVYNTCLCSELRCKGRICKELNLMEKYLAPHEIL